MKNKKIIHFGTVPKSSKRGKIDTLNTYIWLQWEGGGIKLVLKGPYGCKWTWETIQRYTKTQIKIKEQCFNCCCTFHSHSKVFSSEIIDVNEHGRLSHLTLRHKLK
jgi:hypothetical protein